MNISLNPDRVQAVVAEYADNLRLMESLPAIRSLLLDIWVRSLSAEDLAIVEAMAEGFEQDHLRDEQRLALEEVERILGGGG